MFFIIITVAQVLSVSFEYFPSSKSAPSARSHSASQYLPSKNQILIFGGKDSNNFSSEFSIFHLNSSEWENIIFEGSIPSARHSMASMISSSEEFFYIFGGFTQTGISNELWRLDLDKKTVKFI